jgi:nitrite reductase/ring-hydroxylating ferredoxin subunit
VEAIMSGEKKLTSGPAHDTSCAKCPLGMDRRTFLRGAALAATATLAALGAAPGAAFAANVRAIAPFSGAGGQRAYGFPTADGVAVDSANDVIIARWQGRVYAFSLRCPHRGTRLEWHADESRIFCPKHKARFRPDGSHDSGRSTRNLDRYEVQRRGAELIVILDALRRVDEDPAGWGAAMVLAS